MTSNSNTHSSDTKWEYKTVVQKIGSWTGEVKNIQPEAYNDMLNELGQSGWELVAIFDTNRSYGSSKELVSVFKKPIR